MPDYDGIRVKLRSPDRYLLELGDKYYFVDSGGTLRGGSTNKEYTINALRDEMNKIKPQIGNEDE